MAHRSCAGLDLELPLVDRPLLSPLYKPAGVVAAHGCWPPHQASRCFQAAVGDRADLGAASARDRLCLLPPAFAGAAVQRRAVLIPLSVDRSIGRIAAP